MRSHVKGHLSGKGGWALWNWNGDRGRLRQFKASKVPGHAVLRTTPLALLLWLVLFALNPLALVLLGFCSVKTVLLSLNSFVLLCFCNVLSQFVLLLCCLAQIDLQLCRLAVNLSSLWFSPPLAPRHVPPHLARKFLAFLRQAHVCIGLALNFLYNQSCQLLIFLP